MGVVTIVAFDGAIIGRTQTLFGPTFFPPYMLEVDAGNKAVIKHKHGSIDLKPLLDTALRTPAPTPRTVAPSPATSSPTTSPAPTPKGATRAPTPLTVFVPPTVSSRAPVGGPTPLPSTLSGTTAPPVFFSPDGQEVEEGADATLVIVAVIASVVCVLCCVGIGAVIVIVCAVKTSLYYRYSIFLFEKQ